MNAEWQYIEMMLIGLGLLLIAIALIIRRRSARRSVPGSQLRDNMEKMRKDAPFKDKRQ